MSWVSAGIASAGLIMQGAQAYQQNKKAKELSKIKRPETGQYQRGALESAKYQAGLTELPGQNLMEQKLDEGSSAALSNLKDVSVNGSGLGSNIASLYRANVDSKNAIGIAAAQNWNANQNNLQGQLMQTGQTEDARKLAPYYDAKGAESALREASARNIGSIAKSAYNVASDYSKFKYMKDQNIDPSSETPTYKNGADWNSDFSNNNIQISQMDPASIAAMKELKRKYPNLDLNTILG